MFPLCVNLILGYTRKVQGIDCGSDTWNAKIGKQVIAVANSVANSESTASSTKIIPASPNAVSSPHTTSPNNKIYIPEPPRRRT